MAWTANGGKIAAAGAAIKQDKPMQSKAIRPMIWNDICPTFRADFASACTLSSRSAAKSQNLPAVVLSRCVSEKLRVRCLARAAERPYSKASGREQYGGRLSSYWGKMQQRLPPLFTWIAAALFGASGCGTSGAVVASSPDGAAIAEDSETTFDSPSDTPTLPDVVVAADAELDAAQITADIAADVTAQDLADTQDAQNAAKDAEIAVEIPDISPDANADSVAAAPDVTAADAAPSACPPADFLLNTPAGQGAGPSYPKPIIISDCNALWFTIISNGLPFYTYMPITASKLTEGKQLWSIDRSPKIAAQTTALPASGPIGVTIAGLGFYGPNDAGMAVDKPLGDPLANAIVDGCLGHASAADYHFHGLSEKCLQTKALATATPWLLPDVAKNVASPLLGWALDGFAVYGRYGCLDKDCKQVAEMKSGYAKTGDAKSDAWAAYQYQPAPNDPSVLDACNGRIEPDGSYRYHATATFPYTIGCFKGTPAIDGETDPNKGGGPVPCKSPEDCVGKCEPGFKSCGCSKIMAGGLGCIPVCNSQSDCVKLPNGLPTKCQSGFCKP